MEHFGGNRETAPTQVPVPREGFNPQPVDVARLRQRLKMTRVDFARRFGFPVETVRHWERGDRKPRRGALVLLNLIDRNSMLALRVLRNRPCE